ncbi:retrovirus-related Pol polyprotein from transposon TNT 1-94 [Nephila pilipes]|uniref:Retrovirus-related Pol polyprotein from transposon TNT 1-94 n=1 Tax=Nephila pilipes TaxID=299642 RepID=A0A8X6QJ32_NEPPI|nr:retrovirus-related Pol polyprotein from transposon TNT 1-94 [Nephila pilipes]
MYLIVYVDDGIISADEEQTVELFLKNLESEFSLVIGEANYFLGMQIEHLESGKIFIHQVAYCRKILSCFDVINSNPVSRPIENGAITKDDSVSLSADVPYREAVGSLMFLAIVTRFDIAYAVGGLSQVLDKPQQIHWTIVRRILRYLNGTKKYGIMYLGVTSATLESCSDSDYADVPLTRRSISGMMFKYNGGAIAWRSQLQNFIALKLNLLQQIKEVKPSGLAFRQGLPAKASSLDGNSLCNWVLTEINHRPLNLFFKDNEVQDRLNAVGLDISLLVQPIELVKALKKQLKTIRGYKDYIVQ